MVQIDLQALLNLALEAAEEAGREILEIYEREDFEVEIKKDKSPLTLADRVAHQRIAHKLKDTYPVLSEEGSSVHYSERKNWKYFWLVDPLDGTKEFINRNGEFTVNISLIENQLPVLGVVYAPVLRKTYWAIKGQGAFSKEYGKTERTLENNQSYKDPENIRIISSRLHVNEDTLNYIQKFPDAELVNMGSSLKFMMLAESKADLYPRFVPTMEWDTAAAQIIVEEAGGEVLRADVNEKLTYNKESLVNPSFIAKRVNVN